jgi:Tfp pilus assembly protein PilF
MKDTAVEWIEGYLKQFNHVTESLSLTKAFEKAKKMEKEQIIRAHLMARCYDNENSVTEAEQYYNETFKSE